MPSYIAKNVLTIQQTNNVMVKKPLNTRAQVLYLIQQTLNDEFELSLNDKNELVKELRSYLKQRKL